MQLSKSLLFIIAGIFLFSPTCAHRSASVLSPGNEVLQRIIYSIAEKRMQQEFDRAVESGPYTLKVYLENFWSRNDPIPETEPNEYRMRFEARLASGDFDFTPPGSSNPDDRVIAYVLYGTPTARQEFTHPARGDCIVWIYSPETEIAAAGSGNRLLKHLEFTVIFQRNAEGSHTLIPTEGHSWRPPPKHLSHKEVLELEGILANEENSGRLRAAAAWRLRPDPDPRALKALLRSALSEDPIVHRAVADAIQPLLVTRDAGSEGFVVRLSAPEDRSQSLVDDAVRELEPADPQAVIAEDPGESATPPFEIYDPAALFHSQTIASLRAASSEADSFLRSHGWLEPEEADALYVGPLETARSLLDSEHPIDAHNLLEPLLRDTYRDNPEAWHLDALALLESASPGGRQQSEERIRRALRLDPGNLRYRLTLARILYRRTFAYYADDTLDRILEEAPTLADAYALKALIRFENYWQDGWRAGGWGRLPFEERLKPKNIRRAEATDMLNKALILDSDNTFATWWLGRHYLLARRWREAIPVMNYLIKEGVHVPEALLARGMAHQHLGHLDLAYLDYEAGLSMLPPYVRAMAEDPRWALPPSEGGITFQRRTITSVPGSEEGAISWEGIGEKKPERESDIFWRAKDPLFSSSVNERLLEQYRRLAYVTWHFAVPNLGLRGWDTHRGRIYLRYGEPIEFQAVESELSRILGEATAPGLESAGELDWERSADLARTLNLVSVWTYPGLRVTFQVGYVTGNFSANRRTELQRAVELKPESSRVEGARNILSMNATWFYFEGPDRQIELIPVVDVPFLFVQMLDRGAGISGACPIKYMILDSNWLPTQQSSYQFDLHRRGNMVQRYWVGQPVVLPAETALTATAYSAAELLPPEPIPAFAARDTLPQRKESELRLSSLVLAKGIVQWLPDLTWLDRTYFIRNDQAVMPKPDGIFSPTEPVYLYAEIYGLEKDAYGATSYQTALSLTALGEKKGLLTTIIDALGNLIRRESREGVVTLLFDREGISTSAQEKLRIAFPEDSEADRFLIQITVTDKITGEQAERSTLLSFTR